MGKSAPKHNGRTAPEKAQRVLGADERRIAADAALQARYDALCGPVEVRHKEPITSQVELLDALGHPWEQEAAYNDRVQRDRHTYGLHDGPGNARPDDCSACRGE